METHFPHNPMAQATKSTSSATLRSRLEWYEANKEDLKDMWESMGEVERFEKGGDFDTFMQGEYEDSRDFSNSGL